MKQSGNRVPGHTLRHEGAPFNDAGYLLWLDGTTGGTGRAKCSCGELSPVYRSAAARKQWHRTHKTEQQTTTRKGTT